MCKRVEEGISFSLARKKRNGEGFDIIGRKYTWTERCLCSKWKILRLGTDE